MDSTNQSKKAGATLKTNNPEFNETEAEFFRELFNNAPLGYQSLNKKGEIIIANQTWLEMLGYGHDEVIGRWFGDFLTPSSQKLFKSRFPRFRTRGETRGVEFEMVHKNGKKLLISIDGRIAHDEQGNFKQTHCILKDITLLKEADAALQESEAHFKSIYSSSPLGIELFDPEGKMIDCNRACLDIFGVQSFDSVKGFKLFEDPNISDDIKIKLQKGQPINYEMEFDFELVKKFKLYPTSKSGTIYLNVFITPWLISSMDRHGYLVHIEDISKRKTAEMRELGLAQILEQSLNEIFIFDSTSLRFIQVNRGARENLGYSMEELQSKTPLDLKPEFTPKSFSEQIKPLLSGDKDIIEFETIHLRKDGSTYPVEVHLQLIKLASQDVFVAIILDTSRRKQAETARIESERLFSTFMDHLPAGVFIKEEDSTAIYVNKFMKDTFGAKKWIGKNTRDLFPEEVAERMIKDDRLTLKKGQNVIEEQIPDKNGRMHHYQTYKFAIQREGKPDLLGGIGYDISDLKQREEDLNKYKRIVSSSNDHLALLDRNYTYQMVNEAYLRAQNRSIEEIIGHSVAELFGEEFFMIKQKPGIDRCLNGETITYRLWIDFPLLGRRFMTVNHYPYYEKDGSITGYVVNARDDTELKQAEEERQKLEEQLSQSQKMEAIGTLAGGIAHDFNNILGAILGYTELSIEDLPDGSMVRENLEQVLSASQRAKELVEQILAFSRKSEREKKPILLSQLVIEAGKFLRSTLPATIEIRQRIADELNPINANSTQIHQVIMNLCTNAAQAMDEKGGILEIRLEEKELEIAQVPGKELPPGRYQVLMVSDTGKGIRKEIISRIFEPYFTTRSGSKGTGMGLSVVHGIVKSHSGEITIYSEAGIGTTVNVYLPLFDLDLLPNTTFNPKGELIKGGNERILLVDDEESLASAIQQILSSLGYRVDLETDSTAAWENFQKDPGQHDLVITDMSMPGLSGTQLTQRIRRLSPDIPVILCTGFSDKINEKNFRKFGINAFIMKPVIRSAIATTIRKLLDEKKGQVSDLPPEE